MSEREEHAIIFNYNENIITVLQCMGFIKDAWNSAVWDSGWVNFMDNPQNRW